MSAQAWVGTHWSCTSNAAADILRNLAARSPIDFADCLGRLDGQKAGGDPVQLLIDLASGQTGLIQLS